jgi:hypothetical protein
MPHTFPHVVLLGDSIFDNRAYTSGEPDVVSHLRPLLPEGWRATLLAVDGATTAGVEAQLRRVPQDASHLVVSIGGNDALQNTDVLAMKATSTAHALELFSVRIAAFERAYTAALARVLALGRRTTVCTVYNGRLDADVATAARLGLALFNDVILRSAADAAVDVLELRSVCVERDDYANPIEPSGKGGLKIARAIARAVGATEEVTVPARLWGAAAAAPLNLRAAK